MDNVATANINSFGPSPKADASPSEPIYVLSASQLKAVISTAVAEACERLIERLSTLETTITTLQQEIIDLKASHETDTSHLAESIAQDRRRISTLEQSSTLPTKKTTDHLDELERMMIDDKACQISIAKAARLLDLSKERMRQLKPLILHDSRFELTWDRQRGQSKRVVIRLKQYIRANDTHAKFAIGIAD